MLCTFVLDWGLVAQLVEHTDCLGQSVSSLADCNVDDHFVDLDLAHDIVLAPLPHIELRLTISGSGTEECVGSAGRGRTMTLTLAERWMVRSSS